MTRLTVEYLRKQINYSYEFIEEVITNILRNSSRKIYGIVNSSDPFDFYFIAENKNQKDSGFETNLTIMYDIVAELDTNGNITYKENNVEIEEKEIVRRLLSSFNAICKSQIIRNKFKSSEEYNSFVRSKY